jgi:DNA polymerase
MPSTPTASDGGIAPSISTTPTSGKVELPKVGTTGQYEWLKGVVLNCEECKKRVRPGRKIVFGVGNVDAEIFFCGEAPGADEEKIGKPFVGRAGQLLTKIILAMGLSRSDVYIANIMNWRPEMPTDVGNRPPTQREMEFCLPLFAGIPLMVTFHPSYLMRNNTNAAKRAVWEDMLAVMDELGMTASEKQRSYFL